MPDRAAPAYPGKDLEAMSFALNYHRWIVEQITPFLGATVAEVGAGVGSVSRMLLDAPIARLWAFEPSGDMYPLLARALAAEPRAQAVNGFFAAQPGDGCFDSVLYVNVLEHIEDDRAELGTARTALKPGGHLVVFVPALPWLYSEFDRSVGHFRRYARRSLAQLAVDSGFEIVTLKYFDLAGVLPWYVNFVLLRNPMQAGSVSLYDRWVVPVMKALEQAVTPPIGKNLLLIARKPGALPAR